LYVLLESPKPVTAGDNVKIVPADDAALVRARVVGVSLRKPAGPVAVTVNT